MSIRFKTLKLEGFRPFRNSAKIELSSIDNKPVTAIIGNNAAGKTSLFHALNWVWYGEIYSKRGVKIPNHRIVNKANQQQGNAHTQVELEFDNEGKSYKLTRTLTQLENSSSESVNSFEDKLFLTIDGTEQSAPTIQRRLNELFPQPISETFFFDGERLDQFEDRLNNPEQSSYAVSSSIEKILGVSSITNAIEAVNKSYDSVYKQFTTETESKNDQNNLVAQIKHLGVLKNANNNEITKNKDNIARDEKIIDDMNEILASYNTTVTDIEERENKKIELNTAEETQLESVKKITRLFSTAWLDLISPKIKKLKDQHIRNTEIHEQSNVLSKNIDDLETTITSKICSHCNMILPNNRIKQLESELDKAYAEKNNLPDMPLGGVESKNIIRMSEKFDDPKNIELLKEHERTFNQSKNEIYSIKKFITDLSKNIAESPEKDVMQAEKTIEEKTKHLGVWESNLKEKEDTKKDLDDKLDKANSQVNYEAGSQIAKLKNQMDLHDDIRLILNQGLDLLKTNVKTKIENDATKTFLEILEDSESVKGLSISSSYALRKIFQNDEPDEDPSEGESQLIAISLISALNMNAIRSAPLVMDTPFGRLDNDNRGNVMKLLPQISHQVVMFVHPAEYNTESTNLISHQIGKEYKIKTFTDELGKYSEIVNS